MKTEAKKSVRGKVSWSIIAAVLVGALAISGIADVSGGGIMSKLFIMFLGAVIVLQIVPCVMLLGAMFKGVASLFHKKGHQTVTEGKK